MGLPRYLSVLVGSRFRDSPFLRHCGSREIFHNHVPRTVPLRRSMDMRKRFLVGFGAVAAVTVGVLALSSRASDAQQPAATGPAALTPADSSSYKGPKQPIFFRHDIHAGQLKMECQYCHYSVAVSSEPGIPSMQT